MIKKISIILIIANILLLSSNSNSGVAGISGTKAPLKDGTIDSISKHFKDSINLAFPNNSKIKEGPSLKGKRSKKNIMTGIMNTLAKLRYRYNLRLKEKPDLKGKITVRFSILASGKVLTSETYTKTFNDSIFENEVIDIINNIIFSKYPDDTDTTEVIYPFIFLPEKR